MRKSLIMLKSPLAFCFILAFSIIAIKGNCANYVDPNNLRSHLNHGDEEYKKNNYREAMNDFRFVLENATSGWFAWMAASRMDTVVVQTPYQFTNKGELIKECRTLDRFANDRTTSSLSTSFTQGEEVSLIKTELLFHLYLYDRQVQKAVEQRKLKLALLERKLPSFEKAPPSFQRDIHLRFVEAKLKMFEALVIAQDQQGARTQLNDLGSFMSNVYEKGFKPKNNLNDPIFDLAMEIRTPWEIAEGYKLLKDNAEEKKFRDRAKLGLNEEKQKEYSKKKQYLAQELIKRCEQMMAETPAGTQ